MQKLKDKTLFEKLYLLSKLLFISALIQYLFAICNGIINHNVLIHADGMYLASIYDNLFVEKLPFNTFKFAGAPYLFPDFILFVIFQWIFQNYTASLAATSITIFTLIMICLLHITNYMLNETGLGKSIVTICLSVYILLVSQNTLFFSTLRYSSTSRHAGEMLVACVLVLLLFITLKKEKAVMVYPSVFILMMFTTLSDRSILKDFLVPCLFVYLLFLIISKENVKKLTFFIGVLLTGAFIGTMLYKNLFFLKVDLPNTTFGQKEKVQALIKVSKEIAFNEYLTLGSYGSQHTFKNYLRFSFPVIFVAYIVITFQIIVALYKKIGNKNNSKIDVYFLSLGCIILLQFGLSIYAVLFHSSFSGLSDIRYFTLSFLLPVYWLLCFCLTYLEKTSKKVQKAVFILISILVIFLSICLLKKAKPGGFNNLFKYTPPNMECLDNAAKTYGIKYGLAGYSDAAIYKFNSKSGIEIYKSSPGEDFLLPFYSLNSPSQFTDNDFSFFLVSDRFDNKPILKQFGEPNETIKCTELNAEILIYNEPEFAEILKYRFKAYFAFTDLKKEGDVLEIPGPYFDQYFGSFITLKSISDKVGVHITSDNRITPIHEKGYFTRGPTLTLLKGTYKVTLYYKTDSNNVGYALLYTYPDEKETVMKFFNTRGKLAPHSLEIEIGKTVKNPQTALKTQYLTYKLGKFAFFPYYMGNGNLEIEKLVITRMNN